MIKSIAAIILSFLSQYSCAQTMHHTDHPSVHGMVALGQQQIYLSHLPMFHSPHDYQVILEVQLDADSQAKYADFKETSPDELVSIVPEEFVLPEMVAQPKPFKADLFKGHFERGGSVFVENATVTITKVIYIKKFAMNETAPESAQYILFGNATEQFLAHSITAKPDFDQILQVKAPSLIENTPGGILSLPGHANNQVLQAGEKINTDIGPIEIQSSIYLEFGDLSM